MDERTKAKLRIIGIIAIRITIYINTAAFAYYWATDLIATGLNPWFAALGGLSILIFTDWILHKLLYNRMNKYIAEKNKGIQLFTLNQNTPQWKRELIEGMIRPQQALFGEEWNWEMIENAGKRYKTQDLQQQKQER